jgi:hypothetical protein
MKEHNIEEKKYMNKNKKKSNHCVTRWIMSNIISKID